MRILRNVLAAGALALSAGAASATPRPSVDASAAVAEAAAQSGLPARWIEAVIAAESAGQPGAVSRAGAMGLMQLMPGTWAELRARLGLGPDPFHVRDNVLAGAIYLRDLYDRFGAPGFLAAYNAGPRRYADHLAGRAGLPAETRAYLARLAPVVSGTAPGRRPTSRPAAPWREASLFPTPAASQGASEVLFPALGGARKP